MLVNFLIAGTQKGGTTALDQFLSTHPQICLAPVKEVHFFDYDQNYRGDGATWLGVPPTNPHPTPHTPHPTPHDRYHSFFPNYCGQPAVGEATPIYMYFPWIAERIKRYNPDMKLILLLRNPVDRAYSHYQMERLRGWELLPFTEAIDLEPSRLAEAKRHLLHPDDSPQERSPLRTHSYCDRGFYAQQIQNLLQFFPRENLLILLNEELQQHHAQTLKRAYDFLGVEVANPLPSPARVLSGNYKPMHPETRAYLLQKFAQEVERLEDLLNVDLSHWKH